MLSMWSRKRRLRRSATSSAPLSPGPAAKRAHRRGLTGPGGATERPVLATTSGGAASGDAESRAVSVKRGETQARARGASATSARNREAQRGIFLFFSEP